MCPKLKKKETSKGKKKHFYVKRDTKSTEPTQEKRDDDHVKINYALSEDMFYYCFMQRLDPGVGRKSRHSTSFILDGGASKHCCNTKEWFTDMKDLSYPRRVRGSFKEVVIKKEGTVILQIQGK